MQCHCNRRFRNLLRNHCSCIWIITETPASPTSYYCKHSNSCHASKKFATQTLESGGSRAEPELESGLLQRAIATCMDLMRPLALFGPCAVSSQTWQYSRNSVKAAWRTKAYFQQSYTNTTAKGRFQQLWCARKWGWALLLYLDGEKGRFSLHCKTWNTHETPVIRKSSLSLAQYVISLNWKPRNLSPFI